MNSFIREIKKVIPTRRIYSDELRRLAWGTDAGFYRLIPQIVIRSKNETEIIHILKTADKYKIPLTFRAAGTSLSGQAISNSVLVIVGKNWEKYELAPDYLSIKLQPGIVGQRVNQILKPFGRKFPPDPASIKSAMVGGIILNNASGMSCGTHENSYKVLQAAKIIFADGTLLDTADELSKQDFLFTHPKFIRQICEIRDQVLKDKNLCDLIRKKYSIKNVTGLSINSFVDYYDPFDIILHLIIGSEGTLAFLAEATMRTTIDYPFKASALLYFPSMQAACEAVIKLKSSPVTAVEMFDRQAIRSVEDKPNAIPELKLLPSEAAVLLIKTESESKDVLYQQIEAITAIISTYNTLHPTRFTDIESEYNAYWNMRSGIFPTVGGTRTIGTSCLIEDVAFQVDDLPEATADLRKLLIKHNYPEAVIYGHALEGNYHFIINQSFDTESEVKRYDDLMNDVVDLVVDKYQGSLKAEHGTGRNMAPFVEREWGKKAFNIMKEVKDIFDPHNLLNPGVIFNDDPKCHIKNLKPLPPVHEIIDKCIECGFCEINCLSSGFTLSSRQRIVVMREITRLRNTGENPERLKSLVDDFEYAGNQTCAVDGLCALTCPVDINVGDYIHVFRNQKLEHNKFAQNLGAWSANNFSTVTSGLKFTLATAKVSRNIMGKTVMGGVTKGLRFISANNFPLWTPELPKPAPTIKQQKLTDNPLKVVYFPSCLNQTMGSSFDDPDQTPLMEKMVALLNKAGYEVILPAKMNNLCCGTIWESKGLEKIANQKSAELELALYKASENGKYPVLCDQSPCSNRMQHTMQNLKLYEPVEFIDEFLLDKLDIQQGNEPVTIHATCSTIKMGLTDKLTKIAKLCSSNVLVPEEVGCCGFAGDKGFTIPDLNEYALRKLRSQVEKQGVKTGYSNSRTCEIGLNTHAGIPYLSIVYLVDKCSKAKTYSLVE